MTCCATRKPRFAGAIGLFLAVAAMSVALLAKEPKVISLAACA